MRFINQIFTALPGEVRSNQDALQMYEKALKKLPLDEPDYLELRDIVRFYLVGERQRHVVPGWELLDNFESRAKAFEAGAEEAIDKLSEQIITALEDASEDIAFDAIVTTTSTGQLMPGLSYRMANRLGTLVKSNGPFIDLGGVGCTGSLKAVNLVRSLDSSFNHILVISLELPTTLVNLTSTDSDVWQGNCTFGDGAAALWISSSPDNGSMALAIEDLRYWYQAETGLKLIHWGYEDYYTFRLADEKTFDRNVQAFVHDALKDSEDAWRDEPNWAIHPAGITLLLRLSRKLGLSKSMLTPTADHYKQNSNMSSASILHVLKDVAESIPAQSSINLLTMGAGFNVIYGQVRKER